MKGWLITYFILLGCFVGAVFTGRQLHHSCRQPLWACVVVALVVFVILAIVLLVTIQPKIKEDNDERPNVCKTEKD